MILQRQKESGGGIAITLVHGVNYEAHRNHVFFCQMIVGTAEWRDSIEDDVTTGKGKECLSPTHNECRIFQANAHAITHSHLSGEDPTHIAKIEKNACFA